MAKRTIETGKRVALVAHDKRKEELVEWAKQHREELKDHRLFATGTTGSLLEKELGLSVEKLMSGPLGGDQQLGAMIAEGRIDLVFFFWDPLEAQPHDSDVKALIRIATVWNIVMASNRTTADFVMASVLMKEPYDATVPNQ